MGWAARRRFVILFIFTAIAVAFLVVVLISAFYKTPSCTDGVQNQGEAGIDCGGPCQYLCTEQMQSPTVLFTKVLQNSDGRTDVIAKIENKNIDAAAKNVPYRISLYGDKRSFLQELTGTVDLPPRTAAVIYLPGVTSGKRKIASAFLEILASDPKWFSMTANSRIVPAVLNITQKGTNDAPRIEAVLANPGLENLLNVQSVVLVHDVNGDVIAASKTIVPVIPIKGETLAIFTWNNAFSSAVASIEVIPVIPLP